VNHRQITLDGRVLEMIQGYMIPQLIYGAVRFGIADQLAVRPMTRVTPRTRSSIIRYWT
jgi:hypothetical protein